jgi:arsenate reductase
MHGYSARSQIAEALLREYAGDHFKVYSAGFSPKPVNPYAIKVMKEIGVDISTQNSKDVKEYLGKVHFGIIITVCSNAEKTCPTMPGIANRLFWPFEDPAETQGTEEEKIAKFRDIRDQIDQKIKKWLNERGIKK